MEELLLKLQKNVEETTNKMRIPKAFVDKHGKNYVMEVYKDKIIIKPVKGE